MMEDYDTVMEEIRELLDIIEETPHRKNITLMAEELMRKAANIDPTTIPTNSNLDLEDATQVIAEVLNSNYTTTPLLTPKTPEVQNPRAITPAPPQSSSFWQQNKFNILIPLIILSIPLIYYVSLPPFCPKPIW